MKYLFFSLQLTLSLSSYSQTDSITVAGRTVTGSVTDNFTDRLIIKDEYGNEFMVIKDRIDKFNIRSRKKYNGVWGLEYVSDMNKLNMGYLPEYRDQKYYLRETGTFGITSAALIVGGGIMVGIGQVLTAKNYNGTTLTTAGSILGSVGTALLIPTFVFVLKAGKTKTYRTL